MSSKTTQAEIIASLITPKMLEAGLAEFAAYDSRFDFAEGCAARIYCAMQAAALSRPDITPGLGDRLPSLAALGVPEEIVEAAAALASQSDVPGLERHSLELIVRLIVFEDRARRPANDVTGSKSCDITPAMIGAGAAALDGETVRDLAEGYITRWAVAELVFRAMLHARSST